MNHPDYDYCNCQDAWEHSEVLRSGKPSPRDFEAQPWKLLPEQWCLRTGIRVMDPDGWDRKNYTVSWNTPITREDFIRRAMLSTCMAWPTPLYDEKWQDQPDEEKEVEPMSKNTDPVTPLSNPILDILSELVKPKAATSPLIDANEFTQAATALHDMFGILVKAGFTESQALELVGRMMKS